MWLREMKKFFRSWSRVVGMVAMPAFFLAFMGMGFQSFQIPGIPSSAFIANYLEEVLRSFWGFNQYVAYWEAQYLAGVLAQKLGLNYLSFLSPGIIGMILLFASMVAGMSILFDREFGFLKEVMVAPVSRLSIAMGRTLGGVTTAIMQGLLILGISIPMGVNISGPAGLSLSVVFMMLISTGFVGLGVAFAAKMTDFQGFMLIMNFIVFPLFFLSGALFPLSSFPSWVQSIAYLDPLTYGVDALRTTLVGIGGTMPLTIDFLILIGFTAAMLLVSTYLFQGTEVD
ncbi:MAG: ABC transporter permease [Candidatus Freyarchaeota archaeon]|nr:ABC transporter permease [Candidatus Jordarchaeia archaeon]